ncbi:MAG: hypothetical protein ACOH1T_05535 [Microbacteriaceae bacterium]
MALFRRTKRVNLGTFVAPEPIPPAPVERVVEEGMLIATTAVRMHVRNSLVVDVIRHDNDFDPEALLLVARHEFETLADQNDATASTRHTQRNLAVLRALSAALRAAAADDDVLRSIVEQAREEAWREVSGVVAMTLAAQAVDPRDPDYERQREKRIRALINVDLAQLELDALPQY